MTTLATSPVVVTCPADGRVVGTVPGHTPDDVSAMADALRAAQPAWHALGPAGRGVWLAHWRDWILDNRKDILTLLQQECGKSWGDATIEALAAVETLNYFIAGGPKFLRADRPSSAGLMNVLKRIRVDHEPYPVVGLITPWNYPVAMPMLDAPAALMAGCAILSKPSEFTPLAWLKVADGWAEIGAPDVLRVATGRGDTGAAVVDVVDMVQFTGSTETGRRIAARAGQRLIPVGLELGGKDAMIVLADADLERATSGAIWAGLFNAGQTCTAVERIYVESVAYQPFVDLLASKVATLRVGMDASGSYETDYGALANEAQLAIVERHVADAVGAGATVVTGGHRIGTGLMYAPTVLTDVDNSMTCMQDETFGPLLPVVRVADAAEAVRLANDSIYGLSASVWSEDRSRAMDVASKLEVGAVNINNAMLNVFQFPAPQAGWKQSGIGGRSGGRDGILKYTRPRVVVSDLVTTKTEIFWYPHKRRSGTIQEFAVGLLGARDWRRRLGRERAHRRASSASNSM